MSGYRSYLFFGVDRKAHGDDDVVRNLPYILRVYLDDHEVHFPMQKYDYK